jgi:hypothetical protein
VDKHRTTKGQRINIRRSAYLINQIVVVNVAKLESKFSKDGCIGKSLKQKYTCTYS